MASKTILHSSWQSVETSIPVADQREIDMARLQKERDHWLTVAGEAEEKGDNETFDGALLAAERCEDRLHNLRIQQL